MSADPARPFAWDASALHAALTADRGDVLGELAAVVAGPGARHITTAVVVEELAGHQLGAPAWVDIEDGDSLAELRALARWATLVGSSSLHNRGEATVLAWAEVHDGIPILDDDDAKNVAQQHGIEAHGTLWVIAGAAKRGHLTVGSASNLVELLRTNGARYPFPPGGFELWAGKNHLL